MKVPEKSSTCLHISEADWFRQFAEAVQAAAERRPDSRLVFYLSITEDEGLWLTCWEGCQTSLRS